jgi:secretion/DNA translocation related TadE-like protein
MLEGGGDGAAVSAHRERGAGSVLIVALVAVVATAGLTLAAAAHGVARGQQLEAAADSAALAAGDVLLGWVAGDPCTVAQRVAAAHAARLSECGGEGLTVFVRVEASILGMTIERSARAGPPDAEW